MPIAVIVGSHLPGDRIVEAFEDKVRRLGYEPIRENSYRAAAEIMSGAEERHLLLFCIPKGLYDAAEQLRSLRRCARRTIVYTHTDHASAKVAIRYCNQGLANGYLVMGENKSERNICELADRLDNGDAPYGPIAFNWRSCKPSPTAFISTSFDFNNRMLMKGAVDPALSALGFRVRWADRDFNRSVNEEIESDIHQCSLLVANVNLDQRNSHHNANVYFEIGMAAGLGLPNILVRRAEEEDIELPADIRGRRWLAYDNEIDLALKLYHGLKPQ